VTTMSVAMMPWGGGQKMQCKQTVNDTTIGGDGQQQQATTGDCSCDGG
jgi:hypothetical protein